MKSQLHPDGVRRITMKIETAVDVADLNLYALHMLLQEPNPIELLKNCNKREIFALARASLQGHGQDTAKTEVPKALTAVDIAAAEDHVRNVYPELIK